MDFFHGNRRDKEEPNSNAVWDDDEQEVEEVTKDPVNPPKRPEKDHVYLAAYLTPFLCKFAFPRSSCNAIRPGCFFVACRFHFPVVNDPMGVDTIRIPHWSLQEI
ncbi:hypothetical protein AMTR_s00005p00064930 [Amborella trichopoda]|uniref:Uncharacterized protein n=1 Tax=Amborella trichopoda TaxID=13333 RepID=W1PA27_AMBTC|nr:hypothetical protein AMTR_s00005p00064930 [Amborella trichopoda]